MVLVMPGTHQMPEFVGKRVIARGAVIVHDRECRRGCSHDGVGQAAEVGLVDDHR